MLTALEPLLRAWYSAACERETNARETEGTMAKYEGPIKPEMKFALALRAERCFPRAETLVGGLFDDRGRLR